MQLSTRLQMVTDFVRKGSVVADVGCDHAYISIYLVINDVALRTYALDINQGPLKKAKENVTSYGVMDRIETRLSDGLKKLYPDQVDTIIIAGMGGALAVKILTEGKKSVDTATDLVLQPQSELNKVRQYLHTNNFRIIEEAMCKEDGKYYTAIHAVKNKEATSEFIGIREKNNEEAHEDLKNRLHSVHLKYGKFLLEVKDNVLKEYLIKEYNLALSIYSELENKPSDNSKARLIGLKEEIKELELALSFYGNDICIRRLEWI